MIKTKKNDALRASRCCFDVQHIHGSVCCVTL